MTFNIQCISQYLLSFIFFFCILKTRVLFDFVMSAVLNMVDYEDSTNVTSPILESNRKITNS